MNLTFPYKFYFSLSFTFSFFKFLSLFVKKFWDLGRNWRIKNLKLCEGILVVEGVNWRIQSFFREYKNCWHCYLRCHIAAITGRGEVWFCNRYLILCDFTIYFKISLNHCIMGKLKHWVQSGQLWQIISPLIF